MPRALRLTSIGNLDVLGTFMELQQYVTDALTAIMVGVKETSAAAEMGPASERHP